MQTNTSVIAGLKHNLRRAICGEPLKLAPAASQVAFAGLQGATKKTRMVQGTSSVGAWPKCPCCGMRGNCILPEQNRDDKNQNNNITKDTETSAINTQSHGGNEVEY